MAREYKIGEVFAFNGERYQCREYEKPVTSLLKRCRSCAFLRRSGEDGYTCLAEFRFTCNRYRRSDLKWVVFKRVEE